MRYSQFINQVLYPLQWASHPLNENQFHHLRQGRALYVYPDLNLVRYYPDIRCHSYILEHALPISKEQLLALIARE